jgi:hypothetical protein
MVRRLGRGRSHGPGRRLDALGRRRAQEAKGQVQAVKAHPADVVHPVGQGLTANVVDDRADGSGGVLGKWHGHEQAPAGHPRERVHPPTPAAHREAAW